MTLRKLHAYVGRAKDAALWLLFPRRCPLCDRPVYPASARICAACEDLPEPVGPHYCVSCGKAVPETMPLCRDCVKGRHDFTFGASVFRFRSVSGSLYRLKYKGRAEYAEFYGKAMAERCRQVLMPRIRRQIRPGEVPVIVPVPMHKSRQRERGYNQAELLARVMARELGLPCRILLMRTAKTPPLRGLDEQERRRHLEGAFSGPSFAIETNSVIMVDDIFTTGATLDACARVLLRCGIERVYFVTAASGEIDDPEGSPEMWTRDAQ